MPGVLTGGTGATGGLVPGCDTLQDGRKRSDANAAGDEQRVLRVEDVPRWAAVRTVYVHL